TPIKKDWTTDRLIARRVPVGGNSWYWLITIGLRCLYPECFVVLSTKIICNIGIFFFFQRHCQRMTKFIADSKDHRALKQEKLQPTPWDLFKPWFKPMKVSAKTTLLQEGQVSRTMYFIEK